MKTKVIKLLIDTHEEQSCDKNYDSLFIKEFNSVYSLLKEYESLFNSYEPNPHAVNQYAIMLIETDNETREYSLLSRDWDFEKMEWKDVQKFELDIDDPDQTY